MDTPSSGHTDGQMTDARVLVALKSSPRPGDLEQLERPEQSLGQWQQDWETRRAAALDPRSWGRRVFFCQRQV